MNAPDCSYGLPEGQDNADQLSQAMKSNSTLMQLCICVKKLNFLSWAIRSVLSDQVTYSGRSTPNAGVVSVEVETEKSVKI